MTIEHRHDSAGDRYTVSTESLSAQIHYMCGKFSHAWYKAVATPDQLCRIGICRPSESNRTGITPSGQPRSGGRVALWVKARTAIDADDRFRAAMDQVLNGTACVDFRLPKPPKHRPPKRRADAVMSDDEIATWASQLPTLEGVEAVMEAFRTLYGRTYNTAEILIAKESMNSKEWVRVLRAAYQRHQQRSAAPRRRS